MIEYSDLPDELALAKNGDGSRRVDAGSIAILEAARRLGSSWKLAVEARLFLDVDVQDPYLAGYRNDSYVTLSIARYL